MKNLLLFTHSHIISNPNGSFHLTKVNENKACPAPKGNNKLIHFTKWFSCNDLNKWICFTKWFNDFVQWTQWFADSIYKSWLHKLIQFTKWFNLTDLNELIHFTKWFNLNDLFTNRIDLVLDWLCDLTWLQFFWREDYQWITMYILIFSSHKTFRWL